MDGWATFHPGTCTPPRRAFDNVVSPSTIRLKRASTITEIRGSVKSSEVVTRPEDQAIAKANGAIEIRPKRGKLTLLSRRIYNVFLYHAQQQGVEKPSYSILLSELIDDARFTSNNTELLKSHIRDMQATTIEWHTSAGQARQWTSTQLLGPVIIDEPGRGQACTITWTYPEPIRDRLVKPAQYTRVLLEISSQMRS